MDAAKLRLEIHRVIENIPEDKLPNILGYISSYQMQPAQPTLTIDKEKLEDFINRILEEDREVLKRLADNPTKRT